MGIKGKETEVPKQRGAKLMVEMFHFYNILVYVEYLMMN